MDYEVKFIISFLVTQAVEIPTVILLYYLLTKRLYYSSFITAFIASALTLPYLWFVFPSFFSVDQYVLIGELCVFIVEALVYKAYLRIQLKYALIFAFIANLLSYLVGFLLLAKLIN